MLSMNIWWLSEEARAQRYSTLLNLERESRTSVDKALNYICPSYKSYIKGIVEHKGVIRKDLKHLESRADLTTHQKTAAIKLYWLIHRKFPKLNFGLDVTQIENWNAKRVKYLFPDHLLDLAEQRPILIWEDREGDNYYQYWWIFWIRSDGSIAMYMPMCNGKILRSQLLLNGTFERFEQVSANDLHFELPTGEAEGHHQKLLTANKSQAVFAKRKQIYKKMSDELMWKLDQAATSVIQSVKVSTQLSQVKLQCDTWLSGLEDKRSNSTKAAIIRSFRRALWFLLKKEIIQHSACAPATYVHNVKEWKKMFHNKVTEHLPPAHWALYLIEKAYYCVDPLAEILINLLTNETTTNNRAKLHAMGINNELIEKAVLAYHVKTN